ncbi:MAG: efflux RND transporter periplasmic adaptor subunit [Bacteroidetes bacterium]|nr:efflux RND transporter periplasmic adaptor subunit [Bacteroidota bacterium]MBU1718773.1 efflux RND transporter periplasmic adaptor subunit [Bacteroidota bacterium]
MKKKKNKTRRYLLIAFTAIILIVVIGKCSGFIGDKGLTEVSTELPERRTIVESVSANGKVQPATQVKISSDVSGEIVELYVKEGDDVKAGDLLAKIDPDIYVSNLERMEATLNSQRANLANSKARLAQVKAQFINAELIFNRNETLYNQGAISQADHDASKAQYEVAKADVEAGDQSVLAADFSVKSSEAALREAQKNLTKTSIYAPVDGTVAKLNVEKGERVVGTSQFAGTEMMIIADLNEMEVNVEVNENDIVKVKLNDTTEIDIDAYLDRKFKGVVTEIATSANTTGVTAEQVTNFDVKIRIVRDSYKDLTEGKPASYSPFRPGMSATVDIHTKRAVNILTLPIQAVTTRADTTGEVKGEEGEGSGSEEEGQGIEVKDKKEETVSNKDAIVCVFVFKDGKSVIRPIKTGIQDNTYIEIIEGISDSDEVITAPYRAISRKLRNNISVKKVPKELLFKKE